MKPRLRPLAIASCAAVLVVFAAPVALADDSGSAFIGALAAPAALADDSGSVVITSITPTSGPIGSILTIEGSGFALDATVTVGSSAPVTPGLAAVTPTSITVTVPADATTGHVVVDETVGTATTVTTTVGPVFTVQRVATATLTLSQHPVVYPHAVTLTGRFLAAGRGVDGQRGTLQRLAPASGVWRQVPQTQPKFTGVAGRVHWRLHPKSSAQYRVAFAATASATAATTPARSVGVRPLLHLTAPKSIYLLHSAVVSGTISPGLSGRVALERRRHHHWQTIAHPRVADGAFSTDIVVRSAGVQTYRVVRAADAAHSSGASRVVRVAVVGRSLSYGATGADVRALHTRLKALHYDVGPATSTYGWDMVHAVTAFEKVQGLTHDGVAGTTVWTDLSHPKHIHLKHPIEGATAVEVNLTKQVLLIAKNGHIWRILDTSTAGGYTYTDSAGYQATAITPTGHFTIKYKINHLVHSKLGYLFRPSYFDYSGDAIHGEGDSNAGGDVPPYPASHGCVRITDLAVDRYYSVFAVGTSVWIYH